MKRLFLLLTASVALLLAPHFVSAARPSGAITDLGTLGGAFSAAFGINNDPDVVRVVGFSNIAPHNEIVHAFYWTPSGPMVDLGRLPGDNVSFAYDVNNHGQVAGVSNGTGQSAVVWVMDGLGTWGIQSLSPLPGASCASARALNDGEGGDPSAVTVVGASRTVGCNSPESRSHAVMWTNAGAAWVPQDLGTLAGDVNSAAYDVNDDGAVVGVSQSASNISSGFLWTATTGMVRLDSLTVDGETYAMAISDGGDVAGFSVHASGQRHAVRWRSDRNWDVEDLGTLGSGCCSSGLGINEQADVVGGANVGRSDRGAQHAFLARAGSTSLIDLGSIRGNSVARALNDFKMAIGESDVGSSTHAVLWSVP